MPAFRRLMLWSLPVLLLSVGYLALEHLRLEASPCCEEASFGTSQAPGDVLLLRDRTGQRLGYLDSAGEMTLIDGIQPEWVPRAVVEEADGYSRSLHLSLDLEISKLALDALASYRGSIVVLDPKTGQILTAVSDRRSFEEGGTPAFEERREPASIAKLITTVASLRAGFDPDAEIAAMTCNGHRVYNGVRLYCPYIARRLRGLDRAMAISCNLAFADLGVQVGRRRMLEEQRRFGFDNLHGPFPGGRILTPQGNDRQLADLSIGLEAADITPLHAALLAAVMANDGVMPVPTLIHAEDVEDGWLGFKSRLLPPTAGRRVIEPEWLPILLSAMKEVAENGTANNLAPPGFPVAMKTGTASDPRWGFHVNYIGIGPLPNPRLAFSIRVTHQRTSRDVRYAARRVSQHLLRDLDRLAQRRGRSPR